MFKSLTKSFKSGASQPNASQISLSTQASSSQDLSLLLEKVKKHNSVKDRTRAAENLQASIDIFPVTSIPEIWYEVQDMLSSEFSPKCRRVGIKLMISCIQRDHPSYNSRMSYYYCIVNTSNLQDFDLQLEAMKELTDNGSNLADFFQVENRIPDVLSTWFHHLATETQEIRIGRKVDIAVPLGDSMEHNFHALIRFIADVFRHNPSLFSDRDIFILVEEATQTCRKTSSEADMYECLNLLDAVVSCTFMPIENLFSLLEVLSGVAGIPSRAEQAWNLVLSLSKSYISNNTFACLCKILEATRKNKVNSNTMRGAARYLQRLVVIYVEEKREAEISIAKVMHAYNASLAIDSLRHNYELCNCIYTLLENKTTRDKFTYEIWETRDCSPLEIIYQISSSDAIQKFASHPVTSGKAPSISMLSLTSGGDRSQAHHPVRRIIEKSKEIVALVADLWESGEFIGSTEVVIDFFVDMSPYVDEKCALIVIDHFKNSHYCTPLSRNWMSNTDVLLLRFFQDMTWGATVRLRALDVIQDAYDIAKEICEPIKIIDLINKVFRNVEDEPDNIVLEAMIHMFEEVGKDVMPEVLDHFSNILLQFFNEGPRRKSITSVSSTVGNDFGMTSHLPSIQSNGASSIGPSFNGVISPIIAPSGAGSSTLGGSPGSAHYAPLEFRRQLVAAAFCRTFVNTFRTSAVKARITYYNLLSICRKSSNDPLTYIEAARLLCRIRSTADGCIYLTNPTNIDGLAANVGRNLSGIEDTSVFSSSMSWWYPQSIPYLSEEDLGVPSWVLKLHSDDNPDPVLRAKSREYEIDISLWYKEILRIIEGGGHWEIYSFIWTHLGPQLANVALFRGSGCDISRLRQIICDQLAVSSRPPQVAIPKDLTRNDVKVTLIRTMSSLISYSDLFSKRDEEHIVRTLIECFSTFEKATVPCIQALLLCCYEIPVSVKKSLGQIFTKFETKSPNLSTGPHILEFLFSLSRFPTLTANFTQDEYKRVFEMVIKYTQPVDASRVISAGIDGQTYASTINQRLSQYQVALAYDIVATWFLTLRLSDRQYMSKFIIRNLILAEGGTGTTGIDSQSLACVDLISRFTYSDLDLTVQTAVPSPMIGHTSRVRKQWIHGSSIITVSTETQSGDSQLIIRRPTGTSIINIKPDEKMIPGWLEELVLKLRENTEDTYAAQRLRADRTTTFTPNYFLLQLIVPLDTQVGIKPIPIPEDDIFKRAINTFDSTPVVDFHKIGVMYVGPGQQDDAETVSSSTGSSRYKKFLDGMGKLVRLKDNRKIYTGGIDVTKEIDGDYAYVWSDKVNQLLFHSTTMVPILLSSSNPHDPMLINEKKRTAGTDLVNIFFDESELPAEFELVKSQFNLVNIVITPISWSYTLRAPPVESNLDSEPISPTTAPIGALKREESTPSIETKSFYQVRVSSCQPDFPAIFAGCHLRILSEDNLALFVRNLVIISAKFADVWTTRNKYNSNWQYRLEQINALRDSLLADANISSTSVSPGSLPQMTSSSSSQQRHQKQQQQQQQQLQRKHSHQRKDSSDKMEDSNVTQSFLGQLTSSEPAATDNSEKPRDGNNGPSGAPAFSMDEPEGQDDDMPLLKHLDFSSFT